MSWISTKDKLPPIKRIVLCAIDGEEFFVGYYNGPPKEKDYTTPVYWDGEEWSMVTDRLNCDNYRNDVFGEVTHWMEIPLIEIDGGRNEKV
jgi:hypothetical protein